MMRLALLVATTGAIAAAAAAAADAPLPTRVANTCVEACPGDRAPVWSPDGKRIAFLRFAGGDHDRYERLFTMNADGSAVAPAFTRGGPQTPASYGSVSWSPDSSRLAFDADGTVWTTSPGAAAPTAFPRADG